MSSVTVVFSVSAQLEVSELPSSSFFYSTTPYKFLKLLVHSRNGNQERLFALRCSPSGVVMMISMQMLGDYTSCLGTSVASHIGAKVRWASCQRYFQLHLFAWWHHQMETFSALLAICAGNSPHKGQWHRALMFSLICVWINDWVNTREAGDFRRYRTHCDVTVMWLEIIVVCLTFHWMLSPWVQ